MDWVDATASTMRPGYLDQRSLEHVFSNIADCLADPGPIPREEAARAMEMHERCSPRCRVKARAADALTTAAVNDAVPRGCAVDVDCLGQGYDRATAERGCPAFVELESD